MEKKDTIWAKWKNIHDQPEQLKRLDSAKSAKLTPIKIDTDDFYGYFTGSSGKYETFLDHCSCIDYNRRKKPCKHMYRLAIELGLLTENVSSDSSQIVVPKKDGVPLSVAVNLIESLNEDVQLFLKNFLHDSIYCNNNRVDINDECFDILCQNKIMEVAGQEPVFNTASITKKELQGILNDNDIKYDKSLLKNELKDWCIENISSFINDLFGFYTLATLTYEYIPTRHKIYKYLSRKFNTEYVFNEDNELIEVRKIDTSLPNDEITFLLAQYGHYKN